MSLLCILLKEKTHRAVLKTLRLKCSLEKSPFEGRANHHTPLSLRLGTLTLYRTLQNGGVGPRGELELSLTQFCKGKWGKNHLVLEACIELSVMFYWLNHA